MPGMKDAPKLYRGLRAVLPTIWDNYLGWQVEGADHVPETEPVIVAANHLSFIDNIIIPAAMDRPLYYLGKADYWDSWRTRWFFKGVGVVPIKREGDGAGEPALATAVEILGSGDCVGIYPEGTRSPDGRLYRGKTGPVRIAKAAGVRIVPCGLIGTFEAQPPGQYRVHRHPVTVRFGPPLDFRELTEEANDRFALRAATDELMYEIMKLTGQEYVDEYAAEVKSGDVVVDEDTDQVPGASERLDRDTGESDDDDQRRAG